MSNKTQEFLKNQGFSCLIEKNKQVTLTGRLNGVLKVINHFNTQSAVRKVVKVDRNVNRIFQDFSLENGDRSDEFCGGSKQNLIDDLNGKVNMKNFEKAAQKFANSNLSKKLKEQFLQCQPRRMRNKSEYDGEFNESRRYDIAPFDGIKKAPGFGRAIDVILFCSVSCQVRSEELNAYGAMAWALVELIEQCGINARVLLKYKQSNFLAEARDGELTINVEAKKEGEYLAPSLLATALKSNFYRRPIFTFIAMGAECLDEKVSSSLGRPHDLEKKIEFKDGQLIIGPNVRNAGFSEIETELLKAVAV